MKPRYYNADAPNADSGGTEVSLAEQLWTPEPTREAEVTPEAAPAPVAQTPTAPATPAQPVPATPTTPLSVTPEALAQAMRQVVPQQQAPQAAPNQADYDRIFNRFVVQEPLVAAIQEGGPAAVAALQQIVEGTARHAATIAQHYIDHHLGQVREQITPLQALREQQEMQSYENQFFTANPDLKDPRFRPLLEAQVAQLRASGARFNTPADAITHVAKSVRALLGGLGLNPAAQPATTAAPARQPATVSTGGQVGAAPGEASTGRSNPLAKALFG